MFNSYPMYNPQASIDRINTQIAELEKMKAQLPQAPMMPSSLTQNFQISPPNHDVIKYANSIDEVQRDMVIGDTPYFSRDMSIVWIKSTKGDIKSYELTEIIPKDEKDIQIEMLKAKIIEYERMKDEQFNTNDDTKQISTNAEDDDEPTGTATKENKSSGISRASTSKRK